MKPYQKLVFIFAAIVLLACVAAPIVKPLVDGAVPKNAKLADKLHYDENTKTYRFGKVFRRLLMVSALAVPSLQAERSKSDRSRNAATDAQPVGAGICSRAF